MSKKFIIITASVLITASILLYVYAQDAARKRRQKAAGLAVPPGYAKQIIDEVALKHGVK